ncbi:MAG: alpha/beta hydrolase [Nanoarchaeota archaeon]
MKFFIIHGAYGHPGENWFPWLKEKLEENGHEVFIPTFPTPENQTLENWLNVFSQYKVNENTIFIGHSLGVPFILSLLENFKAKACFLVAGFCTLPENQFKEGMRTFVKDFDYQKIRKNCKKFYVYHSNNDPYVQLFKGEELAEKVRAKFTLIDNAGHFNEKAGYLQFQKLLTDIIKECSS